MLHLAPLMLLAACGTAELVVGEVTDTANPLVVPPSTTSGTTTGGLTDPYDQDGDGYTLLTGDCNDQDPLINPAADILLGDGIDNNCQGPFYGQQQMWMEIEPGLGAMSQTTVTGWATTLLTDGDGVFVCYRTWQLEGIAEVGAGVLPDCQHCTAQVDLDFTTALETVNPLDPDYCGPDVSDPFDLMLSSAAYWFDQMGFVHSETARAEGIEVSGYDIDTWETFVGTGWTTTHLGALPAANLSNNPMVPGDGWEVGGYALVEEGTGANLTADMAGGYYVGALFWSLIEF